MLSQNAGTKLLARIFRVYRKAMGPAVVKLSAADLRKLERWVVKAEAEDDPGDGVSAGSTAMSLSCLHILAGLTELSMTRGQRKRRSAS